MLSVQELLEDPVRFDRTIVEIVGWYVHGREHRAIYPLLGMDTRNGIWLVAPEAAAGGERALRGLHRDRVVVLGTFVNKSKRGAGHFNQWPAELRNIKSLERYSETTHASNNQP